MTEILTIDGGQKDAFLRRANIKKKFTTNTKLLTCYIYHFLKQLELGRGQFETGY